VNDDDAEEEEKEEEAVDAVEEDRDVAEGINDSVEDVNDDANQVDKLQIAMEAVWKEYESHEATKKRYEKELWTRFPIPNGGCVLDQLQGIWFALAAAIEIQQAICEKDEDAKDEINESMSLTKVSMADIKARAVHVVHVRVIGLLVKKRGQHRAFGNA
jgi:hypothetical protein